MAHRVVTEDTAFIPIDPNRYLDHRVERWESYEREGRIKYLFPFVLIASDIVDDVVKDLEKRSGGSIVDEVASVADERGI